LSSPNSSTSHSKKPLGAYAILEKLKKQNPLAAPPTVYRALDYLVKNHMIHRIEKLNAYIVCDHAHDNHEDVVQFLVCSQCGQTREIETDELSKRALKIAATMGYKIEHSIFEMVGLCPNCA
jgi:Fur family zinc uptake transcriptional regulator